MEEWRAVLIDSTALSMLNGHELLREDFYYGTDHAWRFPRSKEVHSKKYVQSLKQNSGQKADI